MQKWDTAMQPQVKKMQAKVKSMQMYKNPREIQAGFQKTH